VLGHHSSQVTGNDIGSNQHIKAARVNFGAVDTDRWAAGAAFVQLSQVSEIGALCIDSEGPVALDRFTMWSPGNQAVAAEDRRLSQMYQKTLAMNPWLASETGFQMTVPPILET
jgi:hypothetical protein